MSNLILPSHLHGEILYRSRVARRSTAALASTVADSDETTAILTKTVVEIQDELHAQALEELRLVRDFELEAEKVVQELIDDDDTCEVDEVTGQPPDDELCVDANKRIGFRKTFKRMVQTTIRLIRGDEDEAETQQDDGSYGEVLERGWEQRGNASALRRNAEVWKFALQCVFRVLRPKKLRLKGATEEDVRQAQVEAATFIRDGLLRLGPTFVKLGQVISTRTDVLPATYTDVLKTLQDEVPGFPGARAKEIVSKELGRPCDDIFSNFSPQPLKAASLGQVHTAYYKGQKVAIKVQRAGLKELFDVDLKNLKKLAELLDKFDPKSDGADRDWVKIYEESQRLLYLEIDYLNEAANAERFARDFKDIDWVRVPRVFREVSTPKVLTMEFVESFKLTDVKRIEALGLDRKVLAKRTADAFLRQIVETGYFHCDPHSGNFCVDDKGNLVYYDFGMMDELRPNVRSGFRKFCSALFAGGPMIGDLDLAQNAKQLVDGVEEAGVLARGADRLAVEKLARYFMRAFKDRQLGKSSTNIKQAVGTDLQTLTENNVFRFPSTFTFIFRAFASIEGIGKELDADYDIGKLAQPFIEKFIETQKGYSSEAEKSLSIFSRATGLNQKDIETAVTSPKKIAYIEETLRAMENGSLKVRVRSLENEKALERLALAQRRMEKLLLASAFANLSSVVTGSVIRQLGLLGAAFFGIQALVANIKIKKFDKVQAKFVSTSFENGEDDDA
jgi:predicted unusual protein kinase regulating ubiquinone biosynthesis (AarF/ABC1/UbiB family)